MRGCGINFFDFFKYLGSRAADIGPVKAGTRGAFLNFLGAQQCGQRQCDTGQRAIVSLIAALGCFNAFPIRRHGISVIRVNVAKHMRVTAGHFVTNAFDDILQSEAFGFGGHLAVEYNLK